MPVLESTDNITPRSILRHRPIGDDKNQSGKHPPTMTSAKTPVVQRASRPRTRPADTQEDDDIAEWQRAEEDEEEKDQQTAQHPVSPIRRASAQPKKLPATPLPAPLGRKRQGRAACASLALSRCRNVVYDPLMDTVKRPYWLV